MNMDYYKKYEPIFGAWTIKRKIGEGNFGAVFEIEREDFGETYRSALKVITIPKDDAQVESLKNDGLDASGTQKYFEQMTEKIVREFVLMSKLKGNSNIVSYEDHKVVKHKNKIGWDILIRMEYLTSLNNYYKTTRVTKRDVIKLGIDMCKALELCAKHNIIHRDIKPENIFVSENGDYKLGDFGVAREIEKTQSGMTEAGSPTYMAPEVRKGQAYGSSVDMYSLGLVLYKLINNNRAPFMPPYPEPISYDDREKAYVKRMNGEPFPLPACAGSGRLAEIAMKASAYLPEDRYSSPTQMREDLEAILYTEDESELIFTGNEQLPTLDNSTCQGNDAAPKNGDYGDETVMRQDGDETVLVAKKPVKSKKPLIISAVAAAGVILAAAGFALGFSGGKNDLPPQKLEADIEEEAEEPKNEDSVSTVSEITEPSEEKTENTTDVTELPSENTAGEAENTQTAYQPQPQYQPQVQPQPQYQPQAQPQVQPQPQYQPQTQPQPQVQAVCPVCGSTEHSVHPQEIISGPYIKYEGTYNIDTYAGNGERQKHDSALNSMSFISPEGITVCANGDVYVTDSGFVRKISGGQSESIEFEPTYITAGMIRAYQNDIYILTNEFQNTDGIKYYGIVKLSGGGSEGVFITEAVYSKIYDFDISPKGKMYVVYYNAGIGINYLAELDLSSGKINYLTEVDKGIQCLTTDANGNIFLGNTEEGTIQFYDVSSGKLKLFAGVKDKTDYNDGPSPLFFEPRRLDYKDGWLYVLDYNLVRRVSVNSSNQAVTAETLAGKVTTERDPEIINGTGSKAVISPSPLADMTVTDKGILITDPKNAIIRIVKK